MCSRRACYIWIASVRAMIFWACSLILFLFPYSESLYFKIYRFQDDATNILYRGGAMPSDGTIEFNKVDYHNRVGQAIYYETVPIWDRKADKLTDFTTSFSFKIETQAGSPHGDGLTFFLAPVDFQIPTNSFGGFLGLFNTTNSDSHTNQIIHIEFDSYANSEWDPVVEHVGININSIQSAIYAPWNASLHSGYIGEATVSYNATTQLLYLQWRYIAKNDSLGDLSYRVDLRKVLPEQVIVGFSASTGISVERHILESWEFSSSLNMPEEGKDKSKESKLAVLIAVSLGVLALVAMAACIVYWRKRRKPVEAKTLTSMNDDLDLERGMGAKRFSYDDLVAATNNFLSDRKLGEGGFGCVYKGELLRENITVAVKKISQGSNQGKKEYITEVKVISNLRHRNLVRLIGYCHDQAQFLLVYEFMPKGSLDSHLFSRSTPLEWTVRYKIAMGLASALLYLHEEWEQCVVHRDIKTSNIMLDSEFNVKLGDFGLARLMNHSQMGPPTTGVAGTPGYMAPEYMMTGKASKESDVYSFGVVILEIASGRQAIGHVDPNSDLGLVQWVWGLLEKGELLSGMDKRLRDFDSRQVECLMIVGLWCAHPVWSLRPSIWQAVQVLKFEGALPNLPKKMPVATY